MTADLLCKVGEACLKGEAVVYPGSTFFIDPSGTSNLQLMFMFGVYAYVLYVSADMIGDGAELLLLVPAYADMVGSIVLPILGAIPDGMIVLFSGIGPLEEAQENVAVGVGGLAGSTIMLLTFPWLLAVRAGLVDMSEDGECTGYKKPAGSRCSPGDGPKGCQFQDGVRKNAFIMLLTSLTYFVIQIPAFKVDNQKTSAQMGDDFIPEVIKESKAENLWALIGTIFSLFLFAFYLLLQYLAAKPDKAPAFMKAMLPAPPPPPKTELAKDRGLLLKIDHYRKNFQTTGAIRDSKEVPYAESLLTDEESKKVNLPRDLEAPLRELYQEYAGKTADKGLHSADMRALMAQIGVNYTPKDWEALFKKMDKDGNGMLDRNEFFQFFFSVVTGDDPLPHEKGAYASEEPADGNGGDGDEDDEDDEMPEDFKDLSPEEQEKAIIKESCKQMLIGTVLVLLFSDPMVDVLSQMGVASGIPTFYISFVLAPLASNASELLSSMKLAAKKTSGSLTQALQTLEGAACMNNTFCVGIFLFLIYYQGLAWKFTAETLSIFLVQFLVFIIVVKSNVQTMKDGYIILAMYPVSLVFVYVLENFCGLD